MFQPVTPELCAALSELVGDMYVLLDEEAFARFGRDETEDLYFPPEVVVRPATTEEVSGVLCLAREYGVPVTPRGGGTGLSGGALPVHGGILLSLDRMNRILDVDEDNLVVVTQPGVITENLHDAVEEVGLFYPPDPASKGSCLIGGNVAENAGGPRALKYGVTKDWVLGLEAVLPGGEVIRTGGKLMKNATGFNLTQLLVGSEGTLAVVTEIILKLIPQPRFSRTLLVPFRSIADAANALTAIFRAKVIPCAAELMERRAIEVAEEKLGKTILRDDDAEAALLIELDGNFEESIDAELMIVGEVCYESGAIEVYPAENEQQRADMWAARRAIGEAVKTLSIYKEEDTVVPRARIPELMEVIADVTEKHGIDAISYGHAGDGNIHVNILKRDLSDDEWAIRELFERVVSLGGQISGEHGIGLVQKEYLPIAFSEIELNLMRQIKGVFDPQGILNPGKVLPDA
jgi:glycolate oxidase